ncbi:hypothetical protein [Providencia rettgeri]|uniref:hypothetical protein n=1 Tax=Providencia TaxID=586 RepID=UPI0024BB7B7B|nr:hypothetical protein [Providencia rettgeri]WHT81945.1 hypothetical protein KOL65_21730 [Providencia rettgeri]
MENSNQEGTFAGFCTALSLSIAILIINHDINSRFFISISIISIVATILFVFTQYKFVILKPYIVIIYLIISLISLYMLMMSSIDEQNNEIRDNAIKARKQAEYVINNCELKIVGANGGFLSSPKNGYLCHDGIIYYISDFYAENIIK